MKHLYRSLIFAATFLFPVVLFNCAEEQLPAGVQLSLVRHRLQLQTTKVSFGYNSNLTQAISVTGENTPWALTGLPEWITASATYGKGAATITLTAKENTSVDQARAATLTFASTAGDYQYSKTITVSQPVAAVYITPAESTLSCLPKGETKTVNIDSNTDWTPTCNDTWATVKKASNTQLQITVTENLGETRTATIHLMRTGTTTIINTLSVTQAEAGVTGSTSDINFAVDGETKTTTIEAEASWTTSVSDAAWISVTPVVGSAGSASLTITTSANVSASARSGFVYVKIGTATKLAIPVSQDGIKYTVPSLSLTLKSTTEPATIDVTANTTWKVISKPEWLEVTLPETLVGTVPLILTPQDNPNTTTRTGQLVIGREGFSGNQAISITQEGKTFGDLEDQMDFPITGGTQSLSIETDGAWTAFTSTSWIHLNERTSGQGNGTLQVFVDANPGKDERTGSLTVIVGQTAQTVTIWQVGLYIRLSCDDLITKSTPSTVQLSVSSNMAWTASSDAEWLTVEPKQGEGDAQLTITAADNPSIHDRTATLAFNTSVETKILSFTQPGRTLSVSTDAVTFTDKGGTSETIIVTTDGTFTVTSSADWLTVQQTNNTFTLKAAENMGAAREATVTVTLTGLKSGETLSCSINVSQAEYVEPVRCPDDNHPHMIDMGLSVKWACCNVGAEDKPYPPVDYGDYFAWGETLGYNSGKTEFYWRTYKWWLAEKITKYCDSSDLGTVDNKTQLEFTDDAARTNWGSPYRMPSFDELSELNNTNNCTWIWTSISGVNGYKVTSKTTGNSIFLPAVGLREYTNAYRDGSDGYYWSSSLGTSNESKHALCLIFDSSDHKTHYNGFSESAERSAGLSIRPVACDILSVFPTSLSFTRLASTDKLSVYAEQDYTFSISDSWITATVSDDKKTITVTVTANTTPDSRSGTITFMGGGLTKTVSVTQAEFEQYDPLGLCPDNYHPHMIDMGLNVKWACCNVGAESMLYPQVDYGDYFAWGETTGFKSGKIFFDWETYKWCNGSYATMTKYCCDPSYGTVDNKTRLEASDDAAHVNWGSPYRMPTGDELESLKNSSSCNWTWTTIRGVNGYKVSSTTTGNSIFLPAAGDRTSILNGAGTYGDYWSSTNSRTSPDNAENLRFSISGSATHFLLPRYEGFSVRPVTE